MTNHHTTQTEDTIHELKVPGVFLDDHCARGLDTDLAIIVEHRNGQTVILATDDGLAELASDARHYAGESSFDEPGLAASARRTVAAINRFTERTAR